MADEEKAGRFITVKVPEEEFLKYKAYLRYIAGKKTIRQDISDYIREKGKLVDEKLADFSGKRKQ